MMDHDSWNGVEIFLRLNGRLPDGPGDRVLPEDYKRYCDMVMHGTICPRGRKYDLDGLWDWAWKKHKELATTK